MKKVILCLLVVGLLLTFVSAQCTDSDVNSAFLDGKNFYIKGNTKGVNTEGTDFCGIRTVPGFSEPVRVDSCEKMEWTSGQLCILYEWSCGGVPGIDDNHAIRWEYECPNGCQDGACIPECTDSDGGKNYYMKGLGTGIDPIGNKVSFYDTCFLREEGSTAGDSVSECSGKNCVLEEKFCDVGKNGLILNNEDYNCPNGCKDGACIQEEGTCTDSDDSSLYFEGSIDKPLTPDNYPDLFEEGYAEGPGHIYGGGSNIIKKYDYCGGAPDIEGFDTDPEKWLSEMMCDENGNVNNYAVECPNGCQDGACIQEEGICTDSDGGINLFIKGTTIFENGEIKTDGCIRENLDGSWSDTEDIVTKSKFIVEYSCYENSPNSFKEDVFECPNGCQDGVCVLEKALKIDSPENGAIIGKPIEIIFTIKNTEDRILEFKDPFTDGNDGLQLIIEDMGQQWNLWSTGDIRDGKLIELKLNPGESVTKTIEFDPTESHFKFSGDVKLILRHFILTDTYGFGSLGSDEINVNIPFTGNVLIERDVGKFKYEASEVEGPFTEAFGEERTMKQYGASYTYKNILIFAMITRLESTSQANDYLNEMVEEFQKVVSISLTKINGNEVYEYNNHMFWISGIDVIYVGEENFETEISLDLAKAYLERFPWEIEEGETPIIVPNDETGPIRISKDEIYACQGCGLDNKCYPFGYRKKGEYCSDNYEFVSQIEADSFCENSFECRSNVCVNDKCISGNLIQRIIEWFRKLFGVE